MRKAQSIMQSKKPVIVFERLRCIESIFFIFSYVFVQFVDSPVYMASHVTLFTWKGTQMLEYLIVPCYRSATEKTVSFVCRFSVLYFSNLAGFKRMLYSAQIKNYEYVLRTSLKFLTLDEFCAAHQLVP